MIFSLFYSKVLLKNRKAAWFLWLSPIFFLLGATLIGMYAVKDQSKVEPFKVAIVNEDPTFATKLVIRQMTESTHLNAMIKTIEVDRNSIKKMMQANEIAAAIYLPKGFSNEVAHGNNSPLKIVGNSQRPLQSQLVRYVLESGTNYVSAAQSAINTVDHYLSLADYSEKERKNQFKQNLVLYTLHVLGRGEVFEEIEKEQLNQQGLLDYYGLSLLVLLIMVWSYMGMRLLKSHSNKSIELRLSSMGFNQSHSLMGRALSVYLLVIFSSGILGCMYLYGKGNLDISMTAHLFQAILTITLLFICFFTIIETIITNDKMQQSISILIILAGASIGEHFVPLVYYPDWLQAINQYSINGWSLKYIFAVMQQQESIGLGMEMILTSCICLGLSLLIIRLRKERVR